MNRERPDAGILKHEYTSEQIKKMLKQGNSRIHVGASSGITSSSGGWEANNIEQRLAQLRNSPDHEPMISEIRTEADRMLDEDIPLLTWSKHRLFADDGSRIPYEEFYFARRKRLTAYALMSVIAPEEERYLEGLLDVIWAICDEYSWCLPAHLPSDQGERDQVQELSVLRDEWMHNHPGTWIDLFAAETAYALAEIRSLLEARLPRQVTERVKYEIYRRVLYPFVNAGPFGWEEAEHNWSAVCAGSISAAAIYTVEDDEQLAIILEKAVHSLDCFLEGFADDGACMEGIYYWGYGFGFYVYAAELIERRTGGAIDLLAGEKVRAIATFQQKCFLSGNTVVNFADSSSEGSIQLGLAHYLAKRYPECEVPELSLRAPFSADHCGRWAPAVRNLLWLDPKLTGQPWGDASYWLADAGWMISRKATPTGQFGFAVKGGHNGEPHNHNDVGHFILHMNGVSLLPDMGWGMYSADYFGDERYKHLCTSSEGHSVPIIGGEPQTTGDDSRATVIAVSTEDELDVLEVELAAAYEVEQLRSLRRRYEWSKLDTPKLVLRDSYQFIIGGAGTPVTEQAEDEHRYEVETDVAEQADHKHGDPGVVERFICISRPSKVARNCYIIESGRNAKVSVFFDADQLDSDVETVKMQNHHGQWVDYYALDFTVKEVQEEFSLEFEFMFDEGTSGK